MINKLTDKDIKKLKEAKEKIIKTNQTIKK